MKKYYPAIKQNIVKSTRLIEGDASPFTIDDEGYAYFAVGNKLYRNKNLFREGTDDSELIITTTANIYHAEKMANGKLLVITYNQALILTRSGNQWSSALTHTGWGTDSHPFQTLRSIDIFNGVVLVSTYGTKSTNANFKAWISRDYGQTWKEIYSTRTHSTNPNNAHIHGISFDKFRNYIWMIVGDDENSRLLYSDTWGNTWKNVDTQPGIMPMLTEIIILPDAIVVGTDAGPDSLIYIPFRDENRLQPAPDIEKMELSLLRSAENDINMYGFFLRGAYDVDVYPHKIVTVFPGHPPFNNFWQVLYSYNGKKFYQIHGNQVYDGDKPQNLSVGDVRVEYIAAITPNNYKVDEEDAGDIAWGLGQVWDGEKLNRSLIEIKLPEWVAVE